MTTKYPWSPLLADLALFNNAIIPADFGGETKEQFYERPSAPDRSCSTTGRRASTSSWSRTPTTGRRASRTSTASPGASSATTTPATSSCRAARPTSTSPRPSPRSRVWPTEGVVMELSSRPTPPTTCCFNTTSDAAGRRPRAARDRVRDRPPGARRLGPARQRRARQLVHAAADPLLRPELAGPPVRPRGRARPSWPSPPCPTASTSRS